MNSIEKIRKLIREELKKIKLPTEFNDNFYKWFKNSQVINSDGSPLICYHGTSKKFSKFNRKFSNQGVFWFTSNKNKISRGESGAQSSKEILEVYLSIQNLAGWNEYEKLGLGQIKDRGFDGIKLDDDYIVFEPNQIKSIYNKGEWDVNNKSIFLENLGPSHSERFNRQLYLHYVETNQDQEFKHISREEFFQKLKNKQLGPLKKIEFDRDRIYRLADKKIIFLDKRGIVVGEAWIETDEDGNTEDSYWINSEYL